MVKARRVALVIVALAIGAFVAVRLFPGEEKKVKKQFAALAKCVSKRAGENPITAASKAQKLRSLLADDCTLRTHIPEFSGGFTDEEVSSLVAQARLQCSTLSLKFYDIQVEFPEKEKAEATLTVNVAGTMTDGARFNETHELRCVLEKVEGTWLFSLCEVVEVLKR